MIEFADVTRTYRRRGGAIHALRAVSFAVEPGTVLAVIGPNGAGKSTLLSLLLGFLRPTRGTVTIAGETPREYLRERGAAYLPERFALPGEWRVQDALTMLAHLDGAGDTTSAVDRLGLAEHADKRVRELSRGLLQRVGLAQALLMPRDLIVLDEPTEGLDPVWRIRLRDLITQLRADGCTIIMASHDLSEVERSADRALLLDAGEIRDTLEIAAGSESTSYRIRLAERSDAIGTAFPTAALVDDQTFTVDLDSAAELSARLGALIALGAVVTAVEPLTRALEERVRDALEQ